MNIRQPTMSRIRPTSRYWREAATLIVAAPAESARGDKLANSIDVSKSTEEHEILMLKRGSKSPFMPDGYVYPGGCVTDEDFDRDSWTAVFNKVTNLGMELVENSFQIPGPRVDMLKCNKQWTSSLLPDVAFRICALRETFEESGLLFVSHKDSFLSDATSYSKAFPRKFVPKMHKMSDDFDPATWRKRVSADSSNFRKLCEQFDVVPNVWALFEWGNWLTPVLEKIDQPPAKPKRFNTMFYVCCLDRQPGGTEACTEETSDAKWKTPRSWLNAHVSNVLKVFGPQLYESNRLAAFRDIGQLAKYIQQREQFGLIQFFPVLALCEDGLVFLLPGDEAFPADPDYYGARDLMTFKQTVEQFMATGQKVHRSHKDLPEYDCSVELPCGLFTNPGSMGSNNSGTDPWGALERASNSTRGTSSKL